MFFRLGFAIGLALLGPAPAVAQACSGDPPFAKAPLHLAVDALFDDSTHTYQLGLGLGARRIFGEFDLGVTTYDYSAGSINVGFSGGFEPRPLERSVLSVCPIASFVYAHGPEHFRGTGLNRSQFAYAVGITASARALHSSSVEIRPVAGVAYAHTRVTLSPATGGVGGGSVSKSFWSVDLGVSAMFGRQVSLKPFVVIPVGLSGGSTTLGISFNLVLIG